MDKENLLAFFTFTQTIFFIALNATYAWLFIFTPCSTLHFSLYAAAPLYVLLSISIIRKKTGHAAFYNLYMFDFF